VTGQKDLVSGIIAASGANPKELWAALQRAGFAIVPKQPSAKMLSDAWAYINDEDGAATWREMIHSFEVEASATRVGKLDTGNG